ncbi:MAG TPA: response regulator [Chloroflexota bacterium]|nr:response regulator [Chloroflexota bacterium]
MAQRSILIVDDQEEIRELLADVLIEHGYATLTAADGKEAIENIKKQRPDLITLDLAMPGLDGHGVLKRLACDPSTSRIPVVVVSAYCSGLEVTPQIVRVVSKPFDVSELLELIRKVFGGGDF